MPFFASCAAVEGIRQDETPPFTMRKAVFCIAKGNLSECKRQPFRTQKVVFRGAKCGRERYIFRLLEGDFG